ncbi:MAG: nitrate ABC transporter substrate-binding protein [Gordonia sp. (in: high G+C Gram-positive bacteria)]|uniref:nitrate ABC transporter substrate-binding protein n=1 Tax=Gordonia sp. (in: high G+C Gram-positive bacteria) TaxID=84139 RepID=UPI0039E3E8D3
MKISMTGRVAALGVTAALTLAACGSTDSGPASTVKLNASTNPATQLAGVCPSTVVVQLDWEPEADYAGIFGMLGPDYTVDTNGKRVTGTLVDSDGKDTGVKLEIRSGGAAIGFQSVSSQMYTDKSILLGTISTDQAITAAAAGQSVEQVSAIQRWSPYILFWDPKTYPNVKTIADLGKSPATVVVAKTTAYQDWLVGTGLIPKEHLDTSYDGSPTRFVADPKVAVEGYATNSPYELEHETPAWNKPVAYQLLKDAGYEMYPSALAVRSEDVKGKADCLSKLIPIHQQALKSYMADPSHVTDTVVDLVQRYQTSWTYSKALAEYAYTQFREHDLISNDTDGAVGSFDPQRQKRNFDSFSTVITKSGGTIPAGVTADSISTNQFIDPKVSLP